MEDEYGGFFLGNSASFGRKSSKIRALYGKVSLL